MDEIVTIRNGMLYVKQFWKRSEDWFSKMEVLSVIK